MSDTSGRLTARGGPDAEAAVLEVLTRLAGYLGGRIRPPELVALLLVGEFGRGEGRVCVDACGTEHPYGELDFLLLSSNLAPPERAGLERRLARDLAEQPMPPGLSARIRVVTLAQMRTSPCSVFWCDARFGHKPLLGDPGPLLAREAFHPDYLPPVAARDHIVETGLPALAAAVATAAVEGAAEAHRDEAIVGCGSALLLLLGEYHWSLQERQCRMAERADVPERFRTAFVDACDRLLWRDPRVPANPPDPSIVQDMHLECERRRLNMPALDWRDYPDAACRATLRQLVRTPISLAVRTIDPPVVAHPIGVHTWSGRLGLRCASRTDALATVYPVVAYGLDLHGFVALATQVLGETLADLATLRRAFLQAWILSQERDVYAAVARAEAARHGMPTAA